MPYRKDPRRGDRHRSGYSRDRARRLRGAREFVAVDGEGIYVRGDQTQRYVLLSDSDGRAIWKAKGLSTCECLEFLLSIPRQRNGARVVVVGFGFSYDAEHILCDLPDSKWKRLLGRWHDCLWGPYRIRYVRRKWLEIWKVEGECKGSYVRVDDVISLFNGNLESVVRDFLGSDALSRIVSEGKAGRDHFSLADKEFLRRYNAEENRLLVGVMKSLDSSLKSLGIRPSHYSSPAILGKWFLTKHEAKRFIPQGEREELREAYRLAFFGGRIEAAGIGRAHHAIYNYDLDSAYPHAIAVLPDFTKGRWVEADLSKREDIQDSPENWSIWSTRISLYRIRWDFRGNPRRFYPFPFRDEHGRVYFPPCGTGWVWSPELEAATLFGGFPPESVEIIEAWQFHEDDPNNRPFSWILEIYRQRAELKKLGNPAQYPLKLAMNSIYGAFAQQLSINPNHLPTFHHMGYAGLITSLTRARIYAEIRSNEEAVISVATDGLYSTGPLRNPDWVENLSGEPDRPELVEYRSQVMSERCTEYGDMISVLSGVYALQDSSGNRVELHGRGFGGAMVPFDDIECAWGTHLDTVVYEGRARFLGHQSARARGKPQNWAMWVPSTRRINLSSAGTKRNPLPRAELINPSRGLVWTSPNSMFSPEDASQPYSFSKDRAKAEIDASVEAEIEDERAATTRSEEEGLSRQPLRKTSANA